jgi:hypothetical protein
MCNTNHKPNQEITSSSRSDLIAKRVTVSLALKSRTFRENTTSHVMDCLQAVRNASWNFSILAHHDLLQVEKALSDNEGKIAGDFVMPKRNACQDLRKDSGTCELCGEQHVRFIFKLCDSQNYVELFESVGSTCIFTFVYNALGVTTSEAARLILEGMKSKLIRIAMAEQFNIEHPNFGNEITTMYAEFQKLTHYRSLHWIKKRANEVGRVAKYFRKNGMVTATRYKQFTEVWPKELNDAHDEITEERRQYVIRSQATYTRILNTYGPFMLTYEREKVQQMSDNETPYNELMSDERRFLNSVESRFYKGRVTPDLACDPTPEQIKQVLESTKDTNHFASDLYRQYMQSGWLSIAQLQAVFGCKNGKTQYGYEPLCNTYGVTNEPTASPASKTLQEA